MKDPRLSQAVAGGEGAPSVQSGPSDSDPFAEYMWMEHEEEFNRQVGVSRPSATWRRPPPADCLRCRQGGGGAVGGGLHGALLPGDAG